MQASLFDFSPPTLSVSQVNLHLRQIIDEDPILQDVWVEGEISNWSPAGSGHIYFTLKDNQANLRCVIWKSSATRLRYRPRGNGEAVQAHGRVSVYEAGGNYQLYVDELQPAGSGALYLEFERLKQQLSAEGLFSEDKKRPLPQFPRRIGVVTSPSAAAWRDILNVLSRRYPLAEVILSPTAVQGDEAPPQIVAALNALFTLTPPVEVIILARGGGSIEDLWAFNNEKVARTVAGSPIPVITGVGHETDFTIVDFAADYRAPTPSAAAEVATPDSEELRGLLMGYRYQIFTVIQNTISQARAALDQSRWRLKQRSPQTQIDNRRQQLDDRTGQLQRLLQHKFSLYREQLNSAQARLNALNPHATLARGYAIVQKGPALITHTTEVVPGDSLTITLHDGNFNATVN